MMRFLRRFWRSEGGSVPIEGMFGGLLLIGWYMIAFQFYDAFRASSIALRTSYTVADLISRERNAIGPKYLDGLKKVFDYLTNAPNPKYTWIRVTIITCSATVNPDPCDGTKKLFSISQNENGVPNASVGVSSGAPAAVHTVTSINAEHARIPILGAGDTAVVLETSYTYWPIFGLGDRELRLDTKTFTKQGLSSKMRFSNFIVTRPRGPRTAWDPTK